MNLVPDCMDDGHVAFQGGNEHAVGRPDQQNPKRQSRHPDATDELITWAVT